MELSLAPLEKLKADLDELVGVVTRFSTLIQSHLNEFFTSDIWQKTLTERQDLLRFLADKDGEHKKKFSRCCYFYSSVSRSSDESHHRFCKQRVVDKPRPHTKKKNSFLSLKKEHEVLRLSSLLKDIDDETNCRKVVDFGSGKGYLGQHLTSEYDFRVLGIEMNFGCSSSAETMKDRMKTAHNNTLYDKYTTVIYTVQDDSPVVLDTLIKDNLIASTSQDPPNNIENNLILTGLHACGDLTVSAIKAFCRDHMYRSLSIVGCCYNLMSENGFPVSNSVMKSNLHLGKTEKMLACQCPLKWKETGQDLNKSLLYRAILQKIFEDKGIKKEAIDQIRFRKLGKKETSFETYIENVRAQCEPVKRKLSHEEAKSYYDKYKNFWEQMQEFHWVRMQLSIFLEKLILLDRLCFLLEQGFDDATLIQLFDATLSPRCYAIVCTQ